MKFSIGINYGRFNDATSMDDVSRDALELVKIADQGGFDIVWTAEHHTIEVTASPNPFQILAFWASQTKNIRLGTGVVSAPYWNPIRLAGEAGLCDVISGGRLELGFGRGSYQYEFDRMGGGMPQQEGGRYMRELIPAVRELWKGDYEHNGEIWKFPATTAAPKPMQKPVPMWIAARDQNTFEFAIQNGCSIMSTALRRPFSEVVALEARFRDAVKAYHAGGGKDQPEHLTLRLGCVWEDKATRDIAVKSMIEYGRGFENLFKNIATVRNGFPDLVDFDVLANRDEFLPDSLIENTMSGTPDEVIAKLERYHAAGIRHFMLGTTFGLPKEISRRSVELFCDRVIPHFKAKASAEARVSA
ncbi:MAG: LLM class flavin-dependent oxidoreductase [Rhodobacterales bacterium]|nr:LLM class flavin-dependent oxidoreductase [Rhodobacterales bacterium]